MSPSDLRPGDRAALLVPGSATYVDAVLSLLAAGVFPVPLDPHLTPRERDAVLADVAPALVVEDDASLAALVDPERCRSLPLGRPMHVTSGTGNTPVASSDSTASTYVADPGARSATRSPGRRSDGLTRPS